MEQGWQPDPSSRHELRYHNGTEWTEHVADAGVQSVDPIPQSAPPTPPGPSGGIAPAPIATPGPGPSGGISPYPATPQPVHQPMQTMHQPMMGHGQHTRRVGKTRNPWGVWLLGLITLGIYWYYWYYKVNEETREYAPSVNVQPGIALLAYMFGGFTCFIATIITIVNTGGRISQCQQLSGSRTRCSGGLGFLFALLLGTHVVYYQSQINKVWDQHGNPAAGTPV